MEIIRNARLKEENNLLGSVIADLLKLSTNNILEQNIDKESDRPIVIHERVHQVSYVVEGEGFVLIDNKTMKICKDNLIIIEKEQEHSFFTETKLILRHFYCPYECFDLADRIIVKT